jgi:hypothetical protein
MSASPSSISNALGWCLVVAPFASILLHVACKPRFWLPSLLVFALTAFVMGIAAYLDTSSFLEGAKSAGAFGLLFLGVAVAIGFVFRLIFWREYHEHSEATARSKGLITRSRIVGGISLAMGLTLVLLMGFEARENLWAFAGGLMFIVFGIAYLFAPRGGATLSQWMSRGALVDGAGEPANPPVHADAREAPPPAEAGGARAGDRAR